jgi:hypothetical protein
MSPQLRLVKVIVQPVFILDHGTHVTEVEHAPIAIPADEWPSYSGGRFPAEVKVWQERLDADAAEGSKPPRTRQKR